MLLFLSDFFNFFHFPLQFLFSFSCLISFSLFLVLEGGGGGGGGGSLTSTQGKLPLFTLFFFFFFSLFFSPLTGFGLAGRWDLPQSQRHARVRARTHWHTHTHRVVSLHLYWVDHWKPVFSLPTPQGYEGNTEIYIQDSKIIFFCFCMAKRTGHSRMRLLCRATCWCEYHVLLSLRLSNCGHVADPSQQWRALITNFGRGCQNNHSAHNCRLWLVTRLKRFSRCRSAGSGNLRVGTEVPEFHEHTTRILDRPARLDWSRFGLATVTVRR